MKKSSMSPHSHCSPILEEPVKKSFRVLEKGPAARSHALDQTKEAAAAAPKKLERKTTEDVNASADAFIKKFRKQLMIQRLESIENYEQMLARGL
ncbi:hypothetical protein ACLB2K_063020 [Fragaria x ananassa]